MSKTKGLVSLVRQLGVIEDTKNVFVPRCECLRKIEGKTFTSLKGVLDTRQWPDDVRDELDSLGLLFSRVRDHLISGFVGKLKTTRWLHNVGVSDACISTLVNKCCFSPITFTISCRYKDFVRMSMTKHFSSCFNPEGCHKIQPYLYLIEPEYALGIVRDKSGQFVHRILIRCCDNGLFNVVPDSHYGPVEVGFDNQFLSNTPHNKDKQTTKYYDKY